MRTPEVPLQIDREKWKDALEGLGIPVRGHRLVTLEADPSGITVTYFRQDEDTHGVVSRGRSIARVRFDVGLAPVDDFASDGA